MEQKLDEIIRLADLPRFTGFKRTQLHHYIERGEFPRPIKLGARAKGWLASEVRAWQHARIAGRDGKRGA
jgi:prophage regulatory protein